MSERLGFELEVHNRIADVLAAHFPDHDEHGGVVCRCGQRFPRISATAWNRHAAGMVASFLATVDEEKMTIRDQPHRLGVANCPTCKQESRFRHLHQTAYGMEGTHMAGTERFECAFCDFVVWPAMAADYPTLKFIYDTPEPR